MQILSLRSEDLQQVTLAYSYYVRRHAFDETVLEHCHAMWITSKCLTQNQPFAPSQGNEPAPLTCILGSHHSNPLRQLSPHYYY